MNDDLKPKATVTETSRRDFIKKSTAIAGVAGIMSMVPDAIRNAAWAAGSDAPEKTEVKVGFIPLTDCASVVIASVMGFDKKYGIKITPSKEASWAGVRRQHGDVGGVEAEQPFVLEREEFFREISDQYGVDAIERAVDAGLRDGFSALGVRLIQPDGLVTGCRMQRDF